MAETGDLPMDSGPAILEISSDEEGGLGVSQIDSFDWISELLDGNLEEAEGSDDVMIVGVKAAKHEENLGPVKRSKSSLTSKLNSDGDEDDGDECTILDGDPDGEKAVVNNSDSGNDDLLIVAEKGQIACRDYPHSRHLCAKFPLKSTLHNNHCDLCHCYVCDIPAPCAYWISEGLDTGHCHATDKEEIWRFKRKCLKQGVGIQKPQYPLKQGIGIIEKPHSPVYSTTSVGSNSVSLQTSHSSKSFQIRSCLRVNRGAPGISNRVHGSQLLRHTYRTNTLPPCPNPSSRLPQIIPRRGTIPQRGRVVTGALRPQRVSPDLRLHRMGSSSGALRSQRASPDLRPKRMGSSSVATAQGNITGYGSCDSNQGTGLEDNVNDKKWQDLLKQLDLEMDTVRNCLLQSNDSFIELQTHACPSQSQAYGQCLPQSNLDATGHPLKNPAVPMEGTALNSFPSTYGWLDTVSPAALINPPPVSSLSNVHTSSGLAGSCPSPQTTTVNLDSVSWTYTLTSEPNPAVSVTDPDPFIGCVSPRPLYDDDYDDSLWSS